MLFRSLASDSALPEIPIAEPTNPLASPEEAAAYDYTPVDRDRMARQRTRLIIGDIEKVMVRLLGLVESTKADELMVTTMVYDHAARRRSYELLAQGFALTPRG